jgi:SAM-dependent methyltransferase
VDWWREFFDEEYAFLYSGALTPERTEREVAGAAAILQIVAGQRVLDLCCGDGRHSVALQRRGLRVTGLDASLPLLRRARARAARVMGGESDEPDRCAEGGEDHPRFVAADARALPVKPAFDAALLLFSSIGYGTDEDTEAMLRAARAALVAGGQLLLECAHRDLHVARIGPQLAARDWVDLDGVRVCTERRLDPVAGVEHAVFRYQRGTAPEEVRRFRHRLYTPTELLPMLARAGFREARVYGDYDRRAFAPDAPFLVLHARAA